MRASSLDTLATALFVKTDDLLTSSPQLAPWRPTVGVTPRLSDAELATLAMMQAILGFTSEARWLCRARAHVRHGHHGNQGNRQAGAWSFRSRTNRATITRGRDSEQT